GGPGRAAARGRRPFHPGRRSRPVLPALSYRRLGRSILPDRGDGAGPPVSHVVREGDVRRARYLARQPRHPLGDLWRAARDGPLRPRYEPRGHGRGDALGHRDLRAGRPMTIGNVILRTCLLGHAALVAAGTTAAEYAVTDLG